MLPGLVSARGAPPTQCQVTCVSDNLSQGGPGGPRAADWSARGWRGSGRGREADQLFPELHNNKRTRTGRRPPGHRRSEGARPAAATSAPAAPLGSRKCGDTGGRAAVGWPLSDFPTRPSPYRDVHGDTGLLRVTETCSVTPRPAPTPPDLARIAEPAPVGRALPVVSVLISSITGTWGVLEAAVGSKYFTSRPSRPSCEAPTLPI